MLEINYLALAAAVLAAFIAGAIWNRRLFGDMIMKLNDPSWEPLENEDANPPAWKLLAELARIFIVALILSWFIAELEILNWTEALQLGFFVWFGFPLMMLAGAMIWEDMPVKLSAIHAGDWLVKLWIMALILSIWQ